MTTEKQMSDEEALELIRREVQLTNNGKLLLANVPADLRGRVNGLIARGMLSRARFMEYGDSISLNHGPDNPAPALGSSGDPAGRYEAAGVRKFEDKEIAAAPARFGRLADAMESIAGTPVSADGTRPWVRDCTERESRRQFIVIGGRAQERRNARECVIRQLTEQRYGVFYIRSGVIEDCVGDYKGPLAREHAVAYAARLGYASAPVIELGQRTQPALNIQRLIADEMTYVRQGTFSPSYLADTREPLLRAYLEADLDVAAAHAALLKAAWQDKPGLLRAQRDTPALIAAALGMKSTELLPVVEVVNDDEKPLCRARLANGDVWTIEPGPGLVLTVTSPSGKRSLVSLKGGVAELVVSGSSNDMAAAAASLEQKFGDEHPEFDRESHALEVITGDSRLVEYWEWVVHQIEADGRSVDDEIVGRPNRCQ